MNPFAFLMLAFICLFSFLHYAMRLCAHVNSLAYSFPVPFEDCPSERSDYWFSEYPKHCIPPPSDHGVSPPHLKEVPLALCLYLENLPQNHKIKFKLKNGVYTCSSL